MKHVSNPAEQQESVKSRRSCDKQELTEALSQQSVSVAMHVRQSDLRGGHKVQQGKLHEDQVAGGAARVENSDVRGSRDREELERAALQT